jgi:hypothetical protein
VALGRQSKIRKGRGYGVCANHARIALRITRAGTTAFTAPNVDTSTGVNVSGLQPGTYTATWTLADANGDTRTEVTQFIEQG